ncbi:hypothetical protein D3C78_1455590 [compost metagenome]
MKGVSRTISTRRRRSFKVTSAARVMRLSDRPWATAASVRIEQGTITMPAVWNAPLASVAPTSRTECTWSASA